MHHTLFTDNRTNNLAEGVLLGVVRPVDEVEKIQKNIVADPAPERFGFGRS
jgi:hypothetical protein